MGTSIILKLKYISGVVYLYVIHLLIFLAESNKVEIWVTGIGNTYLEA